MSDLIKQTLAAGEVVRWRRPAGLMLINEAATPIDVQIMRAGTEVFGALAVGRGVKVRPAGGFDEIVLKNPGGAAVAVEVFVTAGDVDVQIATGIEVTVDNAAGNPVPVDVLGAALTANNFVWKSDGAVTDSTAAPTNVAAQFAALDATRRSLRVKNVGAVAVAIGGAAVAFATAAIVLEPGDVWVEEHGAGCAWYAVTAAGAGALAVQGVA